MTGAEDEIRRLPGSGEAASIALVGLGSGPVTANLLRRAAGSAARQLTGATRLAIALPTASEEDVLAVLEGASIGSYSFTKFRSSQPEKSKLPASDITVLTQVTVVGDPVARAGVVPEPVHAVPDLYNTPPTHL